MRKQDETKPTADDGPVERVVRPQGVLLTDWFPAAVKPVRPGMYEVGHDPATMPHHGSRHRLTIAPRRFWDGTAWRAGWLNEQVSIFGSHPSHRWRGVLRPNELGTHAEPAGGMGMGCTADLYIGDGRRRCGFCGCNTNAKMRACCDRGREADRAASFARAAAALDKTGKAA